MAGPSPRRVRLQRSARVWRLTLRNGARFLVHKLRGLRSRDDAAARAARDEQYVIRTAQDVAAELGHMKGVVMKAAQLASVIAETLPDEAQAALATLQADAPPMAPSLAAGVVREELGRDPQRVFLDWSQDPVAAASIGQVHRAVLHDGREVAVKVQYPGVAEAMGADLDNADALYRVVTAFALKSLDAKALVAELRDRMTEELDYRREASRQTEFARAFAGHPAIIVPSVVQELSTGRVLTTEWAAGWTWNELVAQADDATRRRCGEVIWRFVQHSVHRIGAFNGDPHPGNYRFHGDGSVTFLDFGMVKRWDADEWARLSPCLDAIIVHRDPDLTVETMEAAGFLTPGHGLPAPDVFEYVSAPYRPYLVDTFTFTRDFMRDTLARIADVKGPYAPVIERLNLPASFVILNRVVWGVTALLGRLGASGPWRAMLLEYRVPDSPPASDLGEAEQLWWRSRLAAGHDRPRDSAP